MEVGDAGGMPVNEEDTDEADGIANEEEAAAAEAEAEAEEEDSGESGESGEIGVSGESREEEKDGPPASEGVNSGVNASCSTLTLHSSGSAVSAIASKKASTEAERVHLNAGLERRRVPRLRATSSGSCVTPSGASQRGWGLLFSERMTDSSSAMRFLSRVVSSSCVLSLCMCGARQYDTGIGKRGGRGWGRAWRWGRRARRRRDRSGADNKYRSSAREREREYAYQAVLDTSRAGAFSVALFFGRVREGESARNVMRAHLSFGSVAIETGHAHPVASAFAVVLLAGVEGHVEGRGGRVCSRVGDHCPNCKARGQTEQRNGTALYIMTRAQKNSFQVDRWLPMEGVIAALNSTTSI